MFSWAGRPAKISPSPGCAEGWTAIVVRSLSIEFVRLVERVRPRWLLWENVPGVLSTDGGRAFGTFLGALANVGYGFAHGILDAQHFGVPQRRRRVYVVGHFGDWRPPAAVFFERESLRGHSAPRGDARQIAPTIPSRRTAGGGLGTDFDCDGGLVAFDCKQSGGDAGPISPTLRSMNELDGNQNGGGQVAIASRKGVRRLTPRECELLQGFPDDHTLVPYRGYPAKDQLRYHAIGNAFCVPVIRWIGERIALVDRMVAA